MKVLHIISGGDTGGAKSHLITLLSQMNRDKADTGLSVTLLCLMEGDFAREAREAGIAVTVIEQTKRYDVFVARRIAKYARANGFDLLHFHGARANFVAVFIRLLLRRVPFCTTVHSDYMLDFADSRYKQALYMPINKFALKRFKFILAMTENMKQLLVSRGFREKRIHVVYNGIRTDGERAVVPKAEYLARHGLTYDPDKLYVGIAARLQKVKGIDVFLRGVKEAAEPLPNAVFLLAGDGTEREGCAAYIRDNDLGGRLTMLGHETDIFSFFNVLDINCLTSYSEGFPSSLLEGGMMEKATISAACGGVPEMIGDGQSGILFPIGDAHAFAEGLKRLAADEGLRTRLGKALRARVEREFSAKHMAKRHLALYEQCLNEYAKKRSVRQ